MRLRLALILCLTVLPVAAALPALAATTVDSGESGAYEQALRDFEAGAYGEAIIRLKNLLRDDPNSIAARLLLGRAYLNRGEGANAETAFKYARSRGAADPQVLVFLAESLMLQSKYADVIEQIHVEGQGSELEGRLLVLRGYAHLEMGSLGDAESSFSAAAERLAQDPAPLLGRVRLAIARGDFDTAAALVERVAADHAETADVWYFKGDVRRVRGDPEGATADYERALGLEPNHFRARLARAAVLIDLGREDDALADLDAIEAAAPGDLQAAYLRALILARRDDVEAAQEILQEAWEKVSQWERATLRNHGPGLLFAGTLSYTQGDLEQARLHLERFIAFDPYHIEARKLLGSINLRENKPEAALTVLLPALKLTDRDVELFSLAGQGYMRTQRYPQATEMFAKAAELAPERSRLLARLALSRFAAGDTAEAVKTLEPALAADPDARTPGTLLAYLHLHVHAYTEALAAARAVIERDPSNPIALNLAGLAQLGLGDEAAARRNYEAALAASPDYWPASLNLGKLELKAGDTGAAEARFREIVAQNRNQVDALLELAKLAVGEQDYAQAARWLEEVRRLAPETVDPMLLLVDVYMAMGKEEDALAAAWKIETKDPTNPAIEFARGRVALAKSEARDARKHLRRAARQFEDSPLHLQRVAGYQAVAGDLEGARQSLRRAIELAPAHLPVQTALAVLELDAGNGAQAMAIAENMRRDHPGSPAGDILAGDLSLRSGAHAAAAAAYGAAMEKQPSSALTVRLYQARHAGGERAAALAGLQDWMAAHPEDALVRRSLAAALIVAERYGEAVAEYERLLEAAPNDANLLNNLAWLYGELGDPRALRYAETAYELTPDDPGVLDTLGWILVQAGEPARGLALLREAQVRGLEEETVRYHIAVALAELGRTEEARRELEQALKRGDDFFGAAKAKALLSQLSDAQ